MSGGWVQLRRGIIDHVTDGRLTPSEYLALVQLILLADSSTGAGTINGPTLMHWCGHAFSLDTAQSILKALNDKGYIRYQASRSKWVQPYTVNKYPITTGPNAGRMTTLPLSSVASDTCKLAASQPADDISDEVSGVMSDVRSDEVRGETADNYNTEKDKENNNDKENDTTVPVETRSPVLLTGRAKPVHQTPAECSASIRTWQMPSQAATASASSERITPAHHVNVAQSSSGMKSTTAVGIASISEVTTPLVWTPLGMATNTESVAGLVWDDKYKLYFDIARRCAISHPVARRRLGIAEGAA